MKRVNDYINGIKEWKVINQIKGNEKVSNLEGGKKNKTKGTTIKKKTKYKN